MDNRTAYFLGRAFAFGNCVGSGMAMDGERWITIHPWGKGKNADYQRIKIDDESGKIVGGMNFKFQGQTLKEAFSKDKTKGKTDNKPQEKDITPEDLKQDKYNQQTKGVNNLHTMLKRILATKANPGQYHNQEDANAVAKQIDSVVNGGNVEFNWKKDGKDYSAGNGVRLQKDENGVWSIYAHGMRLNMQGLYTKDPELSKLLAEDVYKNLVDPRFPTMLEAIEATAKWKRGSIELNYNREKAERIKHEKQERAAKLEPRTKAEYEATKKRLGFNLDYDNYKKWMDDDLNVSQDFDRMLSGMRREVADTMRKKGVNYYNLGDKEFLYEKDSNGKPQWVEINSPDMLSEERRKLYNQERAKFDKNFSQIPKWMNHYETEKYMPQTTSEFDKNKRELLAERDRKATALANLNRELDFKKGRVETPNGFANGLVDKETGVSIYKDFKRYCVMLPESRDYPLGRFPTLSAAKKAAKYCAEFMHGKKSIQELSRAEKQELSTNLNSMK